MASGSQASESDPHERDGSQKSDDDKVTDMNLAHADSQGRIQALESQIKMLREFSL
jgi:hypothetical protein